MAAATPPAAAEGSFLHDFNASISSGKNGFQFDNLHKNLDDYGRGRRQNGKRPMSGSLNESTMRRLNEGTIGHVKIDLGDCRLCEAAGKMGVTATACHPILKDGVLDVCPMHESAVKAAAEAAEASSRSKCITAKNAEKYKVGADLCREYCTSSSCRGISRCWVCGDEVAEAEGGWCDEPGCSARAHSSCLKLVDDREKCMCRLELVRAARDTTEGTSQKRPSGYIVNTDSKWRENYWSVRSAATAT